MAPSNGRTRKMKSVASLSRHSAVTPTASKEHGPISFMEAQSIEHNLEQNIVETNAVQNAQGSMGSKAAPDIARRTSGSELMCKTLSLTSCGMDNLSASTPFTQLFSSASGTAVDIGAFMTYMTQFASQMNHLATQIGVPLSPGVVPNAEPRHNGSGSSGHGVDEDNRSFGMHTD